jgi:hypothetical protein
MRLSACPATLALALALVPTIAGAQADNAGRWRLGMLVESLHFSRGLVDGGAPESEAAGLRPSGGAGVSIALARAGHTWRADLSAGWAGLRPQADNDNVAVTDKTARLTRWRLGAAAEHRLCAVGAGSLAVGGGPTLDWWRITGESRVRLGAQAGIALRLPVSGWELENRFGLGLSGSPFIPEDAGAGFETRTLVGLLLGMGVRAPL